MTETTRIPRNNILRESLLNWYEFRKDADLAEIGDGGSGLTDLFRRTCRSVTLLEPGEEEAQAASRKYDYVVVPDQLEYEPDPAAAVRKWLSLLRPEGILLICADNRFGLKYFCGAAEKHTGLPFCGVNGYFGGITLPEEEQLPEADGRSFSRREIEAVLRAAGAGNSRFYYPVPDRRMPQMIFTDAYTDGTNISERLIDYNYEDRSMTGIEHRILPEAAEGGALPFLANDFLIEITRGGVLSDIDYALVTTDRGENGMAVTIRSGGSVIKRPLRKKGEDAVRNLAALTEELRSRGVPAAECTAEEDGQGLFLKMPRIRGESLTKILDRLVREDPAHFLRIFDRIYGYIRQSSSPLPGGGCRVFTDLAPCNCFWLGTDEDGTDRLLFYDQEFVTDDGSPEFAMFRTIKYYFASSPAARSRMSAEELFDRYGISKEDLPRFEEKEAVFISSIRHTGDFGWLYEAARPHYASMLANMKKLRKEPAKPYRTGYVPGVFDLFHTGHLRLIERCKERCDYLIVGVLTDELAEYYKGRKPVISCENRMAVNRGLRAVDRVIPVGFDITDKLRAWDALHYDCHFSGDDHIGHWNDVLAELRKRGSNMEFFSYTEGISSTSIRNEINTES